MHFIDKHELGVSNAWNATKLFINTEITEVLEFSKGYLLLTMSKPI
jgi:hypothetical protein